MRLTPWACIGLLAAGCGDADLPLDDDGATVEESGERRDDPRYRATLSRTWFLKGDGFTAGDRELVLRVTAPATATRVRASVDSGSALAATRGSDGAWTLRVPLASLATGAHTLRVASGTSRAAVATRVFNVSAPLYVVVSTDWDDTRFDDRPIARMEELRRRHPAMKYTHFFAPYHYTDPEVTPAHKDAIERWVKAQRDQYGDELGVHIHGWCHWVTTTGVRCRTEPSFAPGDSTGYITVLAAYSEAEMRTMLEASVRTFEARGLGRPRSFRAGGWTADLGTLRALAAAGFTADSSALPAHRIASWRGYNLYNWNARNWAGITETSQPYYPSNASITSPTPSPSIPVLEVPDNGVLVDYITGPEMVDVFERNDPNGSPLARPTLYQVGFHPPNFSDQYLARMEEALAHVDEHLYASDRGPAVYVRIADLTRVWRR